eukprot:3148569-Rhodomonas_salina.1
MEMKELQRQNVIQQERLKAAMGACAQKLDDVLETMGSWIEQARRKSDKDLQKLSEEINQDREKTMGEVLKIGGRVDLFSQQLDNIKASQDAESKKQADRDLKYKRMENYMQKLANHSSDAGFSEKLTFTTKQGSVKLGSLASEAILSGCDVPVDRIIHSCGIGGRIPRLDGRNGGAGCDGYSPDCRSGADGGDGMVGEMGRRGLDCDNFHVEMMTVDNEDGGKMVVVSHSGQKGRVEWFEVTEDDFFYVDGRGGSGGSGGTGGDGEDGMANSCGPGGKGGRAAKGGKGGPGGAGAQIVITTNDPLLLMRILVDCTGWERRGRGLPGRAWKGRRWKSTW